MRLSPPSKPWGCLPARALAEAFVCGFPLPGPTVIGADATPCTCASARSERAADVAVTAKDAPGKASAALRVVAHVPGDRDAPQQGRRGAEAGCREARVAQVRSRAREQVVAVHRLAVVRLRRRV